MKMVYALALLSAFSFSAFAGQGADSKASAVPQKTFAVKMDTANNGSIRIEPALPSDGKVASGSVLTVTALPAAGFAFDSGYYAVPGKWGKMYYESMTPTFKVTIDQDKFIGASFIEKEKLRGFKVVQDVVYAQPGVKKLKYDVFSPRGAKKLPCIVIVHGGGWSTNTEDIMRGLARELIKEDRYVAISIDYRWIDKLDGDSTPNTLVHLIEDVYGAIAHIQERCGDYGCDPTRIGVTGDSAGGHLSAAAIDMTEYIGDGGFGKKPGVFEFMPSYMPKGKTAAQVRKDLTLAIKAAAPSYGVFSGSLLKNFAGSFPDESWLRAVSPIDRIPNVKTRAVPQYLLRGTKDMLITNEAVQAYAEALKAAGQTVKYVQVEGANHAFFDWKPDAQTKETFARYGVPYAEEMGAFFDSVFAR